MFQKNNCLRFLKLYVQGIFETKIKERQRDQFGILAHKFIGSVPKNKRHKKNHFQVV